MWTGAAPRRVPSPRVQGRHQPRAAGLSSWRVVVALCYPPPPPRAARVRIPAQSPQPDQGDTKGAKGAPFPRETKKRQRGLSGRPERALQCERRRPARRGPCWKMWLIRQPVHLKGSGSRPEGRGKGKLPLRGTHPTTSTGPNARSLRGTRHRPRDPQAAPTPSARRSLRTALHQDQGPRRALACNCRGAPGQRGGEE